MTTKMSDLDFMKAAVAKTREGIEAGNSPFGATVVKNGEIVASAHNTVWPDTDPTAHAEVNAIRLAAKKLNTIDLSGCVMYTTCEPCPMCLSAIHWARIDRVVYGATIADAQGSGFNELRVDAKKLAEMGGSKLIVEKAASADSCRECAGLFQEWKSAAKCDTY
ncbi:MAG TPA: nucleoside deaminase [Terriglobales bacterium]|nr:nucleoside deaminase [Terriglobales bacterium]